MTEEILSKITDLIYTLDSLKQGLESGKRFESGVDESVFKELSEMESEISALEIILE